MIINCKVVHGVLFAVNGHRLDTNRQRRCSRLGMDILRDGAKVLSRFFTVQHDE